VSPKAPPRSIAGIKNATEQEILKIGGPVPLCPFEVRSLVRAAERFTLLDVGPLLRHWSKDGDIWACRHWPWAAYACQQWLFQHSYRVTHQFPDMRPTDVKDALKRIAKNADTIVQDLALLQMSANNGLTAAKDQPGHIGWLLTFIGLSQDYDLSAVDALKVGFNDAEVAASVFLQNGMAERLIRLGVSAEVAAKVANTSLLTRNKAGTDPMLPNFVLQLKAVWESLTDRTASVAKVHRTNESRPDFVIFCQSLAELAIGQADVAIQPAAPTHDMIAAALNA
jgi:hypothetical protein